MGVGVGGGVWCVVWVYGVWCVVCGLGGGVWCVVWAYGVWCGCVVYGVWCGWRCVVWVELCGVSGGVWCVVCVECGLCMFVGSFLSTLNLTIPTPTFFSTPTVMTHSHVLLFPFPLVLLPRRRDHQSEVASC